MMSLQRRFLGLGILLFLGVMLVAIGLPHQSTEATPPLQSDDPVEQGEYLANIFRCASCHTPNLAEYDAEELTEDQTRVLALFPREALNRDMWMAGGRTFNFGPAGSVTSSNLTSDEETGLGSWTDEELKATLQTGVTPSGRRMHGIMPTLNGLADSDVDALIAYLRSLDAVSNEVVNELEVGSPPAEVPEETIVAPDAVSDPAERGKYLVDNMACSGCHTPTDPETRRPLPDMYLAGRDPFEQSYGTVYAGNITPHEETGIGTWSDGEIKRALNAGVRIDGRRLSFMPWQDYSFLSADDLDAMVFFLINEVDSVENSIPQTSLAEPYIEIVDVGGNSATSDDDTDDDNNNRNIGFAVVAGILVLLIGGAVTVLMQRRKDD